MHKHASFSDKSVGDSSVIVAHSQKDISNEQCVTLSFAKTKV